MPEQPHDTGRLTLRKQGRALLIGSIALTTGALSILVLVGAFRPDQVSAAAAVGGLGTASIVAIRNGGRRRSDADKD